MTDIRRVTVNHGPEQVITKVRFTDLVKESDDGPSGMAVFFDSRPGRKGPELRFDTGLQEGTAKVRVAVKMVDFYDGSHPVTDWLGKPRSFTSYVAAG